MLRKRTGENMPELEINANENIFWLGEPGQSAGFEAHYDKVIVLQDDWRSGLECATCLDRNKHRVQGRDVSTVTCKTCNRSGKRPKAGNPDMLVRCSDCDGEGWIICPDCDGKGGTIITPDNQKGRPTTGRIVSIGHAVTHFKRGGKVIYPSYAGNAYDMTGITETGEPYPLILVVLREEDILSYLYGSMDATGVKRAEARYTNA